MSIYLLIALLVCVWVLGGIVVANLAMRSTLFEHQRAGSRTSVFNRLLIVGVAIAAMPALGIAIMADHFGYDLAAG